MAGSESSRALALPDQNVGPTAMMTPGDNAGPSRVQRFGVLTGAGQPPGWPPKVKARINSKQEAVCTLTAFTHHKCSPGDSICTADEG